MRARSIFSTWHPAGNPAPAFVRVVNGEVGYTTRSSRPTAWPTRCRPHREPIETRAAGQAIYSTNDGEHWTVADTKGNPDQRPHGRGDVPAQIGTAPGADAAQDAACRVGASHDGETKSGQRRPAVRRRRRPERNGLTQPLDFRATDGSQRIDDGRGVDRLSVPTWTTLVVAARAAGHDNVTTQPADEGFDMIDLNARCKEARQAHGGHDSSVRRRPNGLNGCSIGRRRIHRGELRQPAGARHDHLGRASACAARQTWPAGRCLREHRRFALDRATVRQQASSVTSSPTTAVSSCPKTARRVCRRSTPGVGTTLMGSTDARSWAAVSTSGRPQRAGDRSNRVIAVNQRRSGADVKPTAAPPGAQQPWVRTSRPAHRRQWRRRPSRSAGLRGGRHGQQQPERTRLRGHDYLLLSTNSNAWNNDLAAAITAARLPDAGDRQSNHIRRSITRVRLRRQRVRSTPTVLGRTGPR